MSSLLEREKENLQIEKCFKSAIDLADYSTNEPSPATADSSAARHLFIFAIYSHREGGRRKAKKMSIGK